MATGGFDGEIHEQVHVERNTNVNFESSQRGFLGEKRNGQHLETTSSSSTCYNLKPISPSSREEIQRNGSSVSCSPQRSSRRFAVPFVKKIDWVSVWDKSKEWIKNPMNMALFVWVVAVGISGAILFMVMTGMLNRALPKAQRDTWFEVNNQILNALFTLMCLYQHPRRFYHLTLLCRWRAGDMHALREAYCKDGSCKPNERKHMMVVILLLHLNCFAQYALCGLNLGYPRSRRPAIGVGLTISFAIGAPAVAGLYNNLSPLGKDYEAEAGAAEDDEERLQRKKLDEKKYSFVLLPRIRGRRSEEEDEEEGEPEPEWMGGLFDLWDDISLAYLSVFCSCCVFGWNASRLGFGNMYVHVVTFILFCLAPFFIFNLAAITIDDNEAVRYALGIGGILLCVFGLLYGGFWRIQMRRRYRLPGSNVCCGKPDVTDCFQWLCCCACSLAQEVRTADAYEIVQGHRQMQMQTQMQPPQPLRFASCFASDRVAHDHDANTTPPHVSVVIRT